MAERGRPPGKMTMRRVQVLAIVEPAALMGQSLTFWQIAKRCQPPLSDPRDARRIVRELGFYGMASQ